MALVAWLSWAAFTYTASVLGFVLEHEVLRLSHHKHLAILFALIAGTIIGPVVVLGLQVFAEQRQSTLLLGLLPTVPLVLSLLLLGTGKAYHHLWRSRKSWHHQR